MGDLPGLRGFCRTQASDGAGLKLPGEKESLPRTHSGRRRKRLRFSLPARPRGALHLIGAAGATSIYERPNGWMLRSMTSWTGFGTQSTNCSRQGACSGEGLDVDEYTGMSSWVEGSSRYGGALCLSGHSLRRLKLRVAAMAGPPQVWKRSGAHRGDSSRVGLGGWHPDDLCPRSAGPPGSSLRWPRRSEPGYPSAVPTYRPAQFLGCTA